MKGVHWLLAVAVAWWLRQGGTSATVPGECGHQCGDVVIPYPFGLETNCARSRDFLLNCATTEGSGIQLQWGNLTIRRISVGDSTMVASLPEPYECYDQNGKPVNKSGPLAIDLSSNPRYRLSDTQNKLTVLGCDTVATVANKEGTFGSGCISYCSDNFDFANETTCSGQGCCQASIPKGLKTLNINVSPIGQNVSASQFNHCGLAFVADNRSFNISNWSLPKWEDVGKSPGLALEWMVEWDVTCEKANSNKLSYACGKNTKCDNVQTGYRCLCLPGYHGNPYNPIEGCKDIDECKEPKKYPCHGKCKNTPGSYKCRCPSGKKHNRKGRCQVSPLGIAVGAIAVSFFGITVTASVSITWRWRIRIKNFTRNGGELLKHQRVQIFKEVELAKATNNYDSRNKLSDGSFSSVHRGIIARDTVVVVKKPKDVHKSIIKGDFQRELEILINQSHKNLVKLKGICLETRIPLLVYEYISNGTLFHHIHQNASTILKSWEDRFKIAAEAALALDYMHSSIKPPIVHGNIKSANILLDQNYSAKVSDFGTSVLISPKHRYIVATQKQDSLGYIDPEYLITGMLTTQSDVYSFGVVLVELLMGKELFVTESEDSINNIHRFISSVKDDTLSDVVNFEGASEEEMERVRMVAEIAMKCLDQSGANRPAMSDVAQQLASISPSSTVEEIIEDIGDKVAEKSSSLDEGTSSCLSCLGMDSACS